MPIESKKCFYILITVILITDLAIILNITFLRQIVGFLFLTLLPGLLIVRILKLNKIEFTEKFVLTVGLSISFLMFFGLLINNLSLSLGYETPLATIPLLISFNLAFFVFTIIAYRTNKDKVFSLPNLNLTTPEKAFLVVPILFPASSIFGMHVMNTADNNIILMFLLISIPIYVAFVCFLNKKFPKRFYPVVIFLISISLLLLLSLRSNHLIGLDVHLEYYFFRTTLDNLHWSTFGHTTLDACLSISLLPTIYHSILNISSEFLFKMLYSLIYSISPLVIYVLSKKYVGEGYAFLASCFFMFQFNFLWTAYNARTNTAILFFALAMMILFSDKIDPLKKRILFIVFMASCMVSHYSTTYIFFFIMLGAFVGIEILSKKYTFKKVISLTIVILFFAFIFFWYSQVTEAAFNAGVGYIENTITNLNQLFVEELRDETVHTVLGEDIVQKGIPHMIHFVLTWITFAFIGIGIITLMIKRKEMSFPEPNFKKPELLREKFEVGYFVIALACAGLFVAMIALPYVSTGYNLDRLYGVGLVILSVFFVIGGVTLSRRLKVRAYLVILLVLIPYFFCVTGVTYQMFGVPRAITLNSEGVQYDRYYVHDQDSYSARWLQSYMEQRNVVTVDDRGLNIFMSQAISKGLTSTTAFIKHTRSDYIYLRYYNIVNGKLLLAHEVHNLTDYSDVFIEKGKIYNNGGSEVWR